jgi:hypothetical protein
MDGILAGMPPLSLRSNPEQQYRLPRVRLTAQDDGRHDRRCFDA